MSPQIILLLKTALLETLLMVGISGGCAAALGIPIGIALMVTSRGGFLEHLTFNRVLGTVVNVMRSIPFVILMVAIIPFTRWLVQTSIGTVAAIVPLAVAAIPFTARLAESALRDVDSNLVVMARAMGASPLQIIYKVLLPEAIPGLITAVILTLVNLVGYSAMAGAIGGGGLGDLGIRYGYQRFQPDVMLAVVILLVLLVQGIQSFGDWLAQRLSYGR